MSSSRDHIWRDNDLTEAETFDRLQAELTRPVAAPDSAYRALDADTVMKRGQTSPGPA